MRDFDFIVSPEKLLTPEIVQMVSSIHEHKGKQELFLEANVDELKTLLEVALVQSTGASNRIEGIFTSDKRLEELVSQKAEPRNRSEQEIAGYREVLSTIYEGYEYINPRPNIILQLHRDLYSYSQGSAGGSYKNSDNVIAETDAEGHQKARFIPVPAFQTAEAMEELCDIPTLNKIRQSPFHGNFAYIRTKLHDFFLCNFANLVINNRFNSIRLRKTPMLQILYTAFEFIVCFQHDTQIIFNKRLIAVFALMPASRTCL